MRASRPRRSTAWSVWAVREAAARARREQRARGGGPVFVEAITYRFVGHSRSDPGKYRPEGELDRWRERDPLTLLRARLERRAGVDGGAARRGRGGRRGASSTEMRAARLAAPFPSRAPSRSSRPESWRESSACRGCPTRWRRRRSCSWLKEPGEHVRPRRAARRGRDGQGERGLRGRDRRRTRASIVVDRRRRQQSSGDLDRTHPSRRCRPLPPRLLHRASGLEGSHAGAAEIEFREAIRQALDEELERDERVIFFGEDVAVAGGVFAVTPGLHEKYGPERVFDTPISELALTGAAFGAADHGAATGARDHVRRLPRARRWTASSTR